MNTINILSKLRRNGKVHQTKRAWKIRPVQISRRVPTTFGSLKKKNIYSTDNPVRMREAYILRAYCLTALFAKQIYSS